MGWLSVSLFVSFHLLLFHFPLHCSSMEALPLCNDDYASALLQFKSSFTLSSSASEGCVPLQSSTPKTTSWENGTNCCLWDGVTCDAVSGHVIGLDLSCSWLQGGFRPNSTIFQLPHLRTLNLAYNNFIASSVSSEIGNLVALTHLNLSRSRFAGEIPSRISQLSQLLSLDLSAGVSSLTLAPSTWEKLILNATGLRELVLSGLDMSLIGPTSLSLVMNLSSSLLYLDLYNTRLQGNLAASGNILCLQNLQKLVLANNENLQGQFPKSNWSSPLRYLDLHTTAFSGEVPDSIGHLSSLEYLELLNCQFEGPLPPAFGNLTQLTYLSLGMNKFNGEISCISNLQNLTYLDLSHNNFSGQISSSFSNLQRLTSLILSNNHLSGQIPSSLSKLQHLTILDLSNNSFSGQIPSSLSNLQNLTALWLSQNNLSGDIPYEFGKLSKLSALTLWENNLGGQLPLSLSNLTQLSSLILRSNKLIGPIPDKLPNVGYIDLSYNLINGTIPSWFYSSPSLYYLSLRDNLLTGSIGVFQTNSMIYIDLSNNKLQSLIPESIFGLVNLTVLSLSSNNFSGPVNFRLFSKLQHLQVLELSNNQFLSINFDDNVDYTPQLGRLDLSFCNINIFPKFLGHLQNLMSLNLSHNKIDGEVPTWLNEMGKDSLRSLDLSHNLLTSFEHLSWRKMDSLDLSYNKLQGSVPIPPFGTQFFSVSNNELTGSIPSALCNVSSLLILELSQNNLTGLIPQCIAAFPNLLVLDLQVNNLVGTIPRNFSERNSLQTLHLNNNQLEGTLPVSLAQCKQLEILDIGDNRIEDTFPNWLEDLQELQVLVLRANKFHGTISRLNTKHPFPKLRIFYLSNNHLNGSLPTAYIKEFQGMMKVDDGAAGIQYMKKKNFSSYEDSVMVNLKGVGIELKRILTTFTTIDLSNNMFDGKIPKVIGELYALKGLNLSHNRITGAIPDSLGDLKNLEWLDLSSNKLRGKIPDALTNLNFLSFLHLSQNQLVGIIPRGKQFNTFMNDSYEGNLGLCGFPLSKTCGKDEGERPPSSSIFDHDGGSGFGWKPVVLGYGCGMIFGMLMGYVVFSTGKPQWLVRIFVGEPNKRAKWRMNKRHANRRRMK